MTKPAHDKIAAGLSDALAFAQGNETKGKIANAAEALPTLTPAQERALLWMRPGVALTARTLSAEHFRRMMEIEALGLVHMKPSTLAAALFGPCAWSLTPAGQAARKAIEKETADGAQ